MSVLVLDNNPRTRALTRISLERAGIAVTEAVDTAEALGIFEKSKHHVIIMEAMSLTVNGLATFLRLRSKPVLVTSWTDDSEALRRAYETGATDIVTMPCNHLVLNYRIRCAYTSMGLYSTP